MEMEAGNYSLEQFPDFLLHSGVPFSSQSDLESNAKMPSLFSSPPLLHRLEVSTESQSILCPSG